MKRYSKKRVADAEQYLRQKIRWVPGKIEGCVAMWRGLPDAEFEDQFVSTAKYLDVTSTELSRAILNVTGLSVNQIRNKPLDTL